MRFLKQTIAFIALQRKYYSGAVVLIFLLSFYGSSLSALFSADNNYTFSAIWHNHYLWHVIQFGFYQAGLSAILAIFFALFVTRALYYLDFRGKIWLLRFFSLTYILPVLIAVLGIIGIYGKNGWLNTALSVIDLQLPNLYGLTGILLAHLFFNIPLASKVLLQALQSIPPQQHKLAAQLNISGWHFFKIIELPYLKQQLFPLFSLIFLLCFTSFTIVLTLGGGPRYTTLEVAIYQAITFEFNLNKAALFALVQFILCLILFVISNLLQKTPQTSLHQQLWRIPQTRHQTLIHSAVLFCIILFLALPLLNILYNALHTSHFWQAWLNPQLWQALGFSLLIAPTSAFFCLLLSLGLLLTTRELQWRHKTSLANHLLNVGTLILAIPTLVLAIGLYLNLQQFDFSTLHLFFIVAICNALMAMPFVIRLLNVPLNNNMQYYEKLCQSLDITGWQRWIIVEKATLIAPLRSAFALATALSLGDFTAIAFFGNQDFLSLPKLLYQQLGHYRTQEAATTAFILLLLCSAIFLFIERNNENDKYHND